ncbi:MAG: DUF4421 domain-containing protein [Bacteroidaceae bacterium]|nr:DUF4421 domain-containing protein [Bacteroidaceae bacterium]
MSKVGNFFSQALKTFNDFDSTYVLPIEYNFTAMLQGTQNYEFYYMQQKPYQVSFAQNPDFRLGPYLGWSFIFLGYTFDVSRIGKGASRDSRFDLSLYTSMVGIDFFYRRTGNDFKIRKIAGWGDDTADLIGTKSDYISTSIRGLDVYYVFNHRRFSLPAVYNQGKMQKRSAGSWLCGANITGHDIKFDVAALPEELYAQDEDDNNNFWALERVNYIDYSVNFGYAYNWVPRRNWCLGIQVLPELGYKRITTKTIMVDDNMEEDRYENNIMNKLDEVFRRRGNLNINIKGRAGIVYNNQRWFTGIYGVINSYNFRRGDRIFRDTFGTINIYVGFFFQHK